MRKMLAGGLINSRRGSLSLLVAGSVLLSALPWISAPGAFAQAGSRTIVAISHRGEHLHHPENTMAAFQAAIDSGADYFETDIRTTADGKLILMHDRTVDRTTNGTGQVSEMTFEQIRSLDAGAKFSPTFANTKVPTFEEALKLAHGKIGVYVDTKEADPKLLVDTIVRADMQDHVVIYGHPSLLAEVQKLRADLKLMPEAESAENCKTLLATLRVKVMAFDASDFQPDTIDCAHKAGVQIYVDRLGSADNPEAWQKAIDLGAAGIQTDLPAQLVSYLRAQQLGTHPEGK
jgi:glycerophosphoryl diester phosphodiesterase